MARATCFLSRIVRRIACDFAKRTNDGSFPKAGNGFGCPHYGRVDHVAFFKKILSRPDSGVTEGITDCGTAKKTQISGWHRIVTAFAGFEVFYRFKK
jgi:hypothetical protein